MQLRHAGCAGRTLRPATVSEARSCIVQSIHAAQHRRCPRSSSSGQRAARSRRLSTPAASASTGGSEPLRAVEGDIVSLHWRCINEDGEVLESTHASGEPTTFEVGTGDIVGNPVFEAFDEAVRGLGVGESATIRAEGGPWQKDLMFTVPRDHPEVARLEGRYKNQGGVHEGLLVELSNGGMAVVVRCDDISVVLDANSMLAGKTLAFELEVLALERP